MYTTARITLLYNSVTVYRLSVKFVPDEVMSFTHTHTHTRVPSQVSQSVSKSYYCYSSNVSECIATSTNSVVSTYRKHTNTNNHTDL